MTVESMSVQQEAQSDVSGAPVTFEIEADRTLGYGSIQNAVPVIRSLRVANATSDAIEGLQVLVRCNPSFAVGAKFRFDRLGSGEARVVAPIDLQPDHSYLAALEEALTASISVSALIGDVEIAQRSCSVEVLAYDQWAGMRALPELLAAYSMPNNPAVDVLLGKAAKLLQKFDSELSLNGYQAKSREAVWKQVSAIYSTIAAEGLSYAEPPASFGNDGQKIRTPDRILDGRIATCLDLTMLFAACFEQAGLRPVILIKQGHAWLGVWLVPATFPQALTEDLQAVRKRVESGEFLVFETTGVAQHPNHRASLRIALEQGGRHLAEPSEFLCAIDVYAARAAQIRPLPSRVGLMRDRAAVDVDEPDVIEAAPSLPPLDPSFLTPIDLPSADTAEGRLSKWKAKLLDLTLRNRLLNFKATKATMELVVPDLAAIEDSLAEGTEFRILANPDKASRADPRSDEVHAKRTGRSRIEDVAREALANRTLIADCAEDSLDANLLAIFAAARTGQEEGGANTLYLAIGFLNWKEAPSAEAAHLAPILLVPVTLTRQSVSSGFRLSRHDDESIINPTLLQYLKSAHELRVPGVDVMPMDDKGVDVGRILQAFRLAVREIKGWEVIEHVHLGIFSFTKYLMWKDLQDRSEQLRTNRVVNHLIENPGKAFAIEAQDGEVKRLDDAFRPQDILAPMLADSSQLKAICAVDSGRDLVLEGPPGTGKSQTITNLISHTLAKGKTVLFVSEKMAALEVVHRRLDEIGLAPFCLELHSSKAKKTEVLEQLGKSLETFDAKTTHDWMREADRLAALRQQLNGLVDALHHEHRCGLTVFDAIGTCIANADREPAPMPWPDCEAHSEEDLDSLRETTRRISALALNLRSLLDHPLVAITHGEWSPSWQDEVLAAASSAGAAACAVEEAVQPMAKALHLQDSGHSLQMLGALDRLADVLLASPQVPAGLAKQAHDPLVRARLASLVQHGRTRQAFWETVGAGWTPQFAKRNAIELQGLWTQASGTWWPKSWFAKRTLAAQLAVCREDQQPPSAEVIAAALKPLADVNEEDQFLRSMHAEAELLLQETYVGVKTDWSAVEAHGEWAKRYVDALDHLFRGDPRQSEALRKHLQPFLSEHRAALAPQGLLGQGLMAFRDAYRELLARIEKLDSLARPASPLTGPDGSHAALQRLRVKVERWGQARSSMQPWCLWRRVRDGAIAQGLQGLVNDIESGVVALDAVESHFEFSYRSWWIKKVVDRDPVLREFSSADHERKIREFRAADQRFQKLTEQYTVAILAGKVPSATAAVVGADSEMGRLRRELQKQRRHLPVRQLIQGLPTLLPKLKPCLLMSPLSVAQYLDARHTQFDLVVFDEASQIPVWDAVGAIARGKQLVVVGDPKQLPPTNFFNRTSDGDATGTPDEEQVEDLESILDECMGSGMNRLSLKWHYRSKHESLITFSNIRYYDSQLVTFPSPVTDDVAVRFESVAGVYDRGGSRTNRAEADAIVKAIEQHFAGEKTATRSLGVVTFNQTQQSLIETLLDARRRSNTKLDKAIAAATREPLFIKNLENVQGDERDVIFFSITYGPDLAGKVTMNFGPLNSEGGHRRLNVAISRAREGVVIFSTLKPEQIDLGRVRAAGVRDLKHYLEFAIRGPRALVAQSAPTGMEPDSPFEEAVIKRLRDKGWVVHPQVGCSGYRIDMGVVDPRAPGRYLVGIECDGASYHLGATARDRDRLRQHILEGLGWRIHRIWSTDWWLDAERQMEKLLARLDELMMVEVDEVGEPEVTAVPAAADREELDIPASNGSGADSTAEAELLSTAPSPGTPRALTIYSQAVVRGGYPQDFYEQKSVSEIRSTLQQIVDAEGPIAEAVLFKRVARAWGLERTGSRIVERLRNQMPPGIIRTHEGERTFYWPSGSDPTTWSGFRVAGVDDASKRHIDEVAIEEISALLSFALSEAGSSTKGDLARTVCRMFGMARTPADSEARVIAAIGGLAARGTAFFNGNSVAACTTSTASR